MLALILHDLRDPLSSSNFTAYQIMHIFPMNFQCFHVNVAWRCFCQVDKMITTRSLRDTFNGAHVHEMLLCVTYFAPSFGSHFCIFSDGSTYVMFSNTFRARVLQTTVCVTFLACRRSVPFHLFGGTFATSAATAGQNIRDDPARSALNPPMSPQSAIWVLHGRLGAPVCNVLML